MYERGRSQELKVGRDEGLVGRGTEGIEKGR